jgi:hypothetical protein
MGMPATTGFERRSRVRLVDIRALVIPALMGRGDLEKNATARFSADRGLFVKRENEEPSEATGPVGSAACRSMAAVR